MRRFLHWFTVEDWKRGIRVVILWGYGYNIVVWGPLMWLTTLLTLFTGTQIPAPPLLPWEHLATGTMTLVAVAWGEKSETKNGLQAGIETA